MIFCLKQRKDIKFAHKEDFQNLSSAPLVTKSTFDTFMKLCCSLFLFAPLHPLLAYYKYKKVFNKAFFDAIKEILNNIDLCTPLYDQQNVCILVGSHSHLLSRSILKSINEINNKYKMVHCRTVVGVGHDLFSICPQIVARLLK